MMNMALRIGAVTRTATPPQPMRPVLSPPGLSPGFRRHRFLIIDTQTMVRHGLALTLMSLHPGAQILQATTMEEGLLQLSGGASADLVLLSVDDLGEDWMDGMAQLVRAFGPIPVLAMSSSDRGRDARACIAAGARAFLLKSDSSDVLEYAIALAMTGDAYVQIPKRLMVDNRTPASGGRDPDVARLTKRQMDIFRLLQSGCSNKEIARRLGVLEGTVKVHIRAMMQKLGARNRTQMAVMAMRCDRAGI